MNAPTRIITNVDSGYWREQFFPFLWGLLFPLRLYLRLFPLQRGKGIILRYLVLPLLPPLEAEFKMFLFGDVTITLRYRETLGLSSLLYGTFEFSELDFVRKYLRKGDNVVDIGANVGLFSVLMGVTLDGSGSLFAIEPEPENFLRLKKNLDRNGLISINVFDCAIGEIDGQMKFNLATDSAYHALTEVQPNFANGKSILVRVRRLDSIWEDAGRPQIAFLKIDVEGGEVAVIHGACRLIESCLPTILIEANSTAKLDRLCILLTSYGYQVMQPNGFNSHNYIFFHPIREQDRSAISEIINRLTLDANHND